MNEILHIFRLNKKRIKDTYLLLNKQMQLIKSYIFLQSSQNRYTFVR